MSNKIDNQIVKVENTNNGGLRAIFNLDGVTLDTPIMGNMGQTCILWKRNSRIFGI